MVSPIGAGRGMNIKFNRRSGPIHAIHRPYKNEKHMIKRARSATSAVLLGIALVIGGCSSQQNTEGNMGSASEERNEREAAPTAEIDRQERQDALDELEDLRDRLNKRLNNVDAEMRRTEDQAQLDRLREHRFELEQNRSRVEDEIRNIEVAERSTWEDVRTKARSTAKDVGDWFDRQGEKFKDLIDEENGNEEMNDQQD